MSTGGFWSTREPRAKDITENIQEGSDGIKSSVLPNLAQTLNNFMPKKNFLKTEYKALRSQCISPEKGGDTLEKIFESEEKQEKVGRSMSLKYMKRSFNLKQAYMNGAKY